MSRTARTVAGFVVVIALAFAAYYVVLGPGTTTEESGYTPPHKTEAR